MSNYAIAYGNAKKIDALKAALPAPASTSEIIHEVVSDQLAFLSISKDGHCARTESGLLFFKGWFQDHTSRSVVLGSRGLAEWTKQVGESKVFRNEGLEGAYVLASVADEVFTVRNDLFSYMPVLYFKETDLFVCSDSLYVLSKMRKHLALPCTLNKRVMHTRSWIHGLACAPMSNQTQIEEINLLSPGKHIELHPSRAFFSSNHTIWNKRFLRETKLRTLFKCEYTHYTSALRNATMQFAERIHAIANLDDVLVNVAISGGLDSRVILAALLSDSIDLDHIDFKTNTHPTRAGDFAVVERLSQRFGFNVNDPDKARNHRRKHGLQLTKMNDRAALWVLSSMGLFDMTYFHDSYFPHPYIIDVGGHGAESIKGTFSAHVFSDLIKRKEVTKKALFSRHGLRHIRKAKKANKRHDSIHSELSTALASCGIHLDEPGSFDWHYLSYKSPIANGRFLDRSAFGLRPFIKRDLFALSVANINPFINAKSAAPGMVHDMLILLNPELAGFEFEHSKNNISQEYIESRLEALGGPLDLSNIRPYTAYGSLKDLTNGPPDTFVEMVEHCFPAHDSDKASILAAMEHVWSSLTDPEVISAYQVAYDTAKERLLDPNTYAPNAGVPAAKIISLVLISKFEKFTIT